MPTQPPIRPRRRRAAWFTWRLALAGLLALASGLWRLRRFAVAEQSMAPTLRPGDFLITTAGTSPRPGDLVVYPAPADPDFFLIKRVVAIGPATVRLEAGLLTVDGQTIAEPWAHGTGRDGAWRLRPGEVVVLGDDRTASSGDSTTIGALQPEAIHSVALLRYWPRPTWLRAAR